MDDIRGDRNGRARGRREMSQGRWLDSVMDDIRGDRNGRARGGREMSQ